MSRWRLPSNWPEALLGSEYAALRTRIQEEFELRAKTSKAPGSAAKVHAATTEMSVMLRRNIEQMPASEFLSGRKFLDSLDYAAQSPAT